MYIKDYNMVDFPKYREGLIAQFGFQDVVQAN